MADISVDVAIVGAGIAGAGLAAHLGAGIDVAILEQESRPGYHSTARSAAIFIRNYGNEAIRALTRASVALFESGDAGLFPTPLLTHRGLMYVTDEAGLESHKALLATADGLLPISLDEAIARVPVLRREWLAAAAYENDAQDIDVSALHEGWLRKARGNGARLLASTPLTAARWGGQAWEIDTPAGRIRAGLIVNAAGAWADRVAAASGVAPLGIQPMRRSMAVVPPPDGVVVTDWPMVADAAENWYFKPDAGKLYVSPAEEIPVDPHDAYVDDMVLAEGLYRFEQAVNIPVTRVERSWAGLRSFAPDRSPVAGRDKKIPAFFWLAGQGGYGIQTSPALSRLAADLIHGREPDPELRPMISVLDPGRFDR